MQGVAGFKSNGEAAASNSEFLATAMVEPNVNTCPSQAGKGLLLADAVAPFILFSLQATKPR